MQTSLEPQAAVIEIKNGKIASWDGLQVASNVQVAARINAGISEENIEIRELVSGSSFGARETLHWLLEAVFLAKATNRPVKLMYSGEDEMRALYYHAASYHKLVGGLDANGNLTAFQLRSVSPASSEEWEPGYNDRKDKMDYSTTEAISKWDFAYSPQNVGIARVRHETGFPTGWYRPVSFSYPPNTIGPSTSKSSALADQLGGKSRGRRADFVVHLLPELQSAH